MYIDKVKGDTSLKRVFAGTACAQLCGSILLPWCGPSCSLMVCRWRQTGGRWVSLCSRAPSDAAGPCSSSPGPPLWGWQLSQKSCSLRPTSSFISSSSPGPWLHTHTSIPESPVKRLWRPGVLSLLSGEQSKPWSPAFVRSSLLPPCFTRLCEVAHATCWSCPSSSRLRYGLWVFLVGRCMVGECVCSMPAPGEEFSDAEAAGLDCRGEQSSFGGSEHRGSVLVDWPGWEALYGGGGVGGLFSTSSYGGKR